MSTYSFTVDSPYYMKTHMEGQYYVLDFLISPHTTALMDSYDDWTWAFGNPVLTVDGVPLVYTSQGGAKKYWYMNYEGSPPNTPVGLGLAFYTGQSFLTDGKYHTIAWGQMTTRYYDQTWIIYAGSIYTRFGTSTVWVPRAAFEFLPISHSFPWVGKFQLCKVKQVV